MAGVGITDAMNSYCVMYEWIDVLAEDVGVEGIFSDWPATVTYYANCMGFACFGRGRFSFPGLV